MAKPYCKIETNNQSIHDAVMATPYLLKALVDYQRANPLMTDKDRELFNEAQTAIDMALKNYKP
jgi:hypothetical protein